MSVEWNDFDEGGCWEGADEGLGLQRSKIEPCYAPFGGYGEEGGRSSQAWVSEAKERM